MREMTPERKHHARLNFPPFSNISTECGRNIYSLFFLSSLFFSSHLLCYFHPILQAQELFLFPGIAAPAQSVFPFFVQVLKRFGSVGY